MWAEAVPVRPVVGAAAPQVGQEPVTQLAHRHRRLADQAREEFRRGRISDEIEHVIHRHQRGAPGEPPDLADPKFLATRQAQPLQERELA